MNKEDYLCEVEDFIEFVANAWRADFEHSYQIDFQPWRKALNGNRSWKCKNLCNAFTQYWWHGSFELAARKLARYRRAWQSACKRGDKKRAKAVVLCIFNWGGVLNSGNNKKSVCRKKGFIPWMKSAMNELLNANDNVTNFRSSRYRMNSAYTKAYAVMHDELIIYDSRVGAALGLLARRFLEGKQKNGTDVETLKPLLAFPWGSERAPQGKWLSASASTRNPSSDRMKFPKSRRLIKTIRFYKIRRSGNF